MVPAVLPIIVALSGSTARGSVVIMENITVITGANKGLGKETARRLKEAGHTVLIGSRDAERGRVAAEELGVEVLALDVTDQ